ncbi:aminoacetone oxidase family FAD-binding enzyme [Halorhodospira neutriphila]|uniref:Aminoacetone oxidase family FAD-binding enzyme n=1 Tax=Halorhodospira neutriphila TaxID=168379 RepID=A0ABS1EBN0_9GAMM|nr:aminoacetone oxidase family FAD-binding enzyme [Halorhodospira neutriphila]
MGERYEVIVVGAGAAGLMSAATAADRGRRVLVLDHARRPGRKLLASGGGHCNFTHLDSGPAHFLSDNPRFCISALQRYTPYDFLALLERYGLGYEDRGGGQLFCRQGSRAILEMLHGERSRAGAELRTATPVRAVRRHEAGYSLATAGGELACESLVIATGGLSLPRSGASGFGYAVARQLGVPVRPTRPGLVPLVLPAALQERLAPLAGISVPAGVACGDAAFHEALLITHRGLSGPAALQASSYWRPGEALHLDLLPGQAPREALEAQRRRRPRATLQRYLEGHLPKRLARAVVELHGLTGPLQGYRNADLDAAAAALADWRVTPVDTEGYRKAEVTVGGVDTRALSSKTLAVRDQPGLFFVGEVLDVTGQLGGHNLQWAWSSGVAAGRFA